MEARQSGHRRQPEQQRVGRRILEVEAELLSLKSSYNSHSSVSQVPNEVLSNIFALVANMDPEKFSTCLVERERARWLRVTHVCRHWRNVAMACGSLWSNINFVTPQLVNAMLERSKSTPLSVKLFYNSPKLTGMLSKVLAQTDRLRSVDLTGPMEKDVISNFSKPAPMLEDLVLKFAGYGPTNLPVTFLQEGAPMLRRLVVDGFSIPKWGRFPLIPSLTHLRLRGSSWGWTRPPEKAFLESLKQMPCLESLELVGFLPIPESIPLPSIDIPTLRTVRFEDSIATITGFSLVVRMPRVSSLRLIFKDERNRGGDPLDRLLAALARNWRTKEQNGTNTLSIDEDYTRLGNGMTFCFSLGSPGDEILSHVDHPTLWVSFEPPLVDMKGEFLLPIVSTLVDLSSLRLLQFGPCREVSPSDWATFSLLEHLETVILVGTSTRTIFKALKPTFTPVTITGHLPETTRTQPSFPALSNLELRNIGSLRGASPSSQNAIYDIINALKRRPELHRIKVLRIDGNCSMSQTAYDLIAKSLPEVSVVWDRSREDDDDEHLRAEGSSEDEEMDEEDSEADCTGDDGSGDWDDEDSD